MQNIINLKNNIEKEINEINKSYDKVNIEVSQFFEKEHEKLTIEENNIKEKLENEVTKIKEKLEISFSESNQIIKNCEKINKGIKAMEKEEKKMIKILSYITKINKTKKGMKYLFQKLLKNLKISFQENQRNIKYDDYYFNGIQTPKDITFTDIYWDSFKVSWKIDNLNIMNINNDNIKYKIELKNNENEQFNQVYFGKESSFLIKNIKENQNYKIRICCSYKNIDGEWSEIREVKTKENIVDSIILKESNREKEFIKKIYEWSGYKTMSLIYRATRDGQTSENFHNKCDNQGPTICLFKNEKGYIFGGYAPISWNNDDKWYIREDSFIFTLTNIHGTEPTKFPHNEGKDSLKHHPQEGPTFDDFYIYNNFLTAVHESKFPRGHKDILFKGSSIITGNIDNNKKSFKLKEIEVFKTT